MAYKKYGFWGSHIEGGYSFEEINAMKKSAKDSEKHSNFHGAVSSDGSYRQTYEEDAKNREYLRSLRLKAKKAQKTKKTKNQKEGEQMRTLRDAVYGLAVGDALGLPVQFKKRDSYHIDGMTGYGTFRLPAGSWSDDTSLTIATCDSLRRMGRVDTADIRRRFEGWLNGGEYTPFGEAFDEGRTCTIAILRGQGCTDVHSNGNGSLMRIIPLAFVEGVTDEQIEAVSAITHAHAYAKECCVVYVHIAQKLLRGLPLRQAIAESCAGSKRLGHLAAIAERPRAEISSSGYVIDSLEAALWCLLRSGSYRDCLLLAVNLGEDTDTVGAIAGGLAGILYGIEGIPAEWLGTMQAMEVIERTLG